MTLAAAFAAFFCARLDKTAAHSDFGFEFLYHGDPDSARTVLSTVAGSMITVAGVAFSVTIVALSLASSQLGPRLLSNFMRDRGNQVVLGGFIGTFIFCLLALGSLPAQQQQFASVSVSVGLVLAVCSLVLLIYFIHHIASSMQADHVIEAVAADVKTCLQSIFPIDEIETGSLDVEHFETESGARVHSQSIGYLQCVDERTLLEIAKEHAVRIRLLRRPGHYLGWGAPLVEVTNGTSQDLDADLARRIRQAFMIGGSRTAEQDPEYGIHQLVEIALRALSPGINDPFTAITCIDHLAGLLSSIAAIPERAPARWDSQGDLRLLLDPIDFVGVVEAAFNQIRQSATGNASVSIRLLEAFEIIAGATCLPDRLAAIGQQAGMVHDANADLLAAADHAVLEERHTAVLHATGSSSQRCAKV